MKNILSSLSVFLFSFVVMTAAQATDEENHSLLIKRAYLSPSVNYISADADRSADNSLGGQFALGYSFFNNFSIETEISSASMDINGGGSFDQLGVGINALVRFPMESAFEPFLLSAAGVLITDASAGSSSNPYLAAGIGAFVAAGENLLLRFDVRYRIDTDDQSIPNQDPFEDTIISVGAVIPLGGGISLPKDDDQDGVRNKKDRCPNTRSGAEVDTFGCSFDEDNDGVVNLKDQCPGTPPRALVDIEGCEFDSDGDGVVDTADRCPGTPQGAAVDSEGCALDSDGDSVIDYTDQCPDTLVNVEVDRLGCEPDNDQDGVVNRLDECPATPVGVQVNPVGCELDNDADGVVNSRDDCPNTPPETVVDVHGCSLQKTQILHNVTFLFDSVELTDSVQNKVLQETAQILRQYVDLQIQITGHTDSLGTNAYNKALSLKRANAIKAYFVADGIDARRISTQGKGESMPIAGNNTEAGRASNRRIELRTITP